MAKAQRFYEILFNVEGAGEFPFDMLRYDGCHPLNESDSLEMERHRREKRVVTLVSRTAGGHAPTKARWKSFGWQVVEGSIVRV